jgi:hypothetical protein
MASPPLAEPFAVVGRTVAVVVVAGTFMLALALDSGASCRGSLMVLRRVGNVNCDEDGTEDDETLKSIGYLRERF